MTWVERCRKADIAISPVQNYRDLEKDPHEINNLATDARFQDQLKSMQAKLKQFQQRTKDPWVRKWQYE